MGIENNTNDEDMKYYEPIGGWTTSNPGVEYLKSMSFLLNMIKQNLMLYMKKQQVIQVKQLS